MIYWWCNTKLTCSPHSLYFYFFFSIACKLISSILSLINFGVSENLETTEDNPLPLGYHFTHFVFLWKCLICERSRQSDVCFPTLLFKTEGCTRGLNFVGSIYIVIKLFISLLSTTLLLSATKVSAKTYSN